MVVQAVVKTTSQSNGNGPVSIPRGTSANGRVSMILEIYKVASMITHTNRCRVATTWMVWPKTLLVTCFGFLVAVFKT